MKYQHHKGSPSGEYVSLPQGSVEVVTGSGAAQLVQELNRLHKDMDDWANGCHKASAERDEKSKTIVELKKQVEDLKVLNTVAKGKILALQSLAVDDNQDIQRLLDAIEASQSVLGAYISPGLPDTAETAQKALSDLQGILGDGKLVTLCRGLRNTERSALSNCLSRWHENADAQITFDYKHWTNVSIEGEYFVALSDGKTAWMRAGFPKDRVVYSPNCRSVSKRIDLRMLAPSVASFCAPVIKPKTRKSLVKVIGILERNHMLKDAKRLKKLLR